MNKMNFVIITLLLMGKLSLLSNIQPANADYFWTETIFIHSDGSISPQEAPIKKVSDVYYLFTDNIVEAAFLENYKALVIERSNIVLDGAGCILQGTLSEYTIGIDITERNNITIKNLKILKFSFGVYLNFSSYNNITGNTITDSIFGIVLENSPNNTISGNIITANNLFGIYLFDHSSRTTISGNVFIKDGLVVYDSYDNVVMDNFVNGKPLVYLEGSSDVGIEDAGQIILVNCSRITVKNLNLSETDIGVELWKTQNSTISGATIANNLFGFVLFFSLHNVFSGNNVSANNIFGVSLWYNSSKNIFYHNNFIGNSRQVYIETAGYANVWDHGYPSGGNYWSDYNGTDADCDGIGDTPYVIDSNNTDRYPLIAPIKVFEVGTWNGVSYNVNIISNSTISCLHFNPDEGPFLRFNVTGKYGTSGFCRVTIPKDLLWTEDKWIITVGALPITNYTIIQDPSQNHTHLYFTYNHSTQTVVIQGTHVIPEFPLAAILPLFMVLSIIAIVFAKRARRKERLDLQNPFF